MSIHRPLIVNIIAALGIVAPQLANAEILDYSSGFGAGAGLIANQDNMYGAFPIFQSNLARLTNSTIQQRANIISATQVDIRRFHTTFTLQTLFGSNWGDGFTFMIQTDGPHVFGDYGGALGWGKDVPTFPHSVAVKFDTYGNNYMGQSDPSGSCTGLFSGGVQPVGGINLRPSNIHTDSTHPIRCDLSYNGWTLTATITDTITNGTATQNYTVNIPTLIGGTTGYVGFSSSTGTGGSATHQVLNWYFSSSDTFAATSFLVTSGDLFSGDVASLLESDDNYLRILNDADSLLARVEVGGTTTVTVPTYFEFTWESSVTRPGLVEILELRSYAGNTWTFVNASVAPVADRRAATSLSSNLGNYVGASGQVRARFKWEPVNDEDPTQDGWVHDLDSAEWTIR